MCLSPALESCAVCFDVKPVSQPSGSGACSPPAGVFFLGPQIILDIFFFQLDGVLRRCSPEQQGTTHHTMPVVAGGFSSAAAACTTARA